MGRTGIRPNALTTIWGLRRDRYSTYVRAIGDHIDVVWDGRCALHLTRADARLLAKRINQCLDRTVKS